MAFSVHSATRPDDRFYINIIQYDDGSWASDPYPMNDIIAVRGNGSGMSVTFLGLISITQQNINNYMSTYITRYAPDYAQRNALYILQTQTSGAAWNDATAMFNWINAVLAHGTTLKTAVTTMTFDQLVVYYIDPTDPGWPVPPPSLMP